MKILLPSQTTYTILFIPRSIDIEGGVLVFIYCEKLRIEVESGTSFINSDGVFSVTINSADYNPIAFTENQKYQIRMISNETDELIYRGKMIVTSQVPQDYKLTNGLYE